MGSDIFNDNSSFAKDFSIIFLSIILLLFIMLIVKGCKELIKHFSKKNLQEKQFSIIFASEKERDHVYSLIEKDKKETEDLEQQAEDFGLIK